MRYLARYCHVAIPPPFRLVLAYTVCDTCHVLWRWKQKRGLTETWRKVCASNNHPHLIRSSSLVPAAAARGEGVSHATRPSGQRSATPLPLAVHVSLNAPYAQASLLPALLPWARGTHTFGCLHIHTEFRPSCTYGISEKCSKFCMGVKVFFW